MFTVVMLVLALGPQASPPVATPGMVALLATRPPGEAAPALRPAISSPDPHVRAIAARVVAVTSQLELVQVVVDALSSEQDPLAAAEQVRAILLLRGNPSIPTVAPHATRIGGAAGRVLTEWRARHEMPQKAPEQPVDGSIRTVEPWLPGLLASAAAAAGCPASGDLLLGFARVTYRADGRPQKIELDPHEIPKSCHVVLDAMARITLLEGYSRPAEGQPQWVLMPISEKYFSCTVAQDRLSVPVGQLMATGSITTPRKKKDVRPRYPEDLIRALVQGSVVLEAWITSTGCIRAVRVLKGVHPVLDVEAARAVLQWEFSPTLRDGAPVPVHVTVTVKFSLR